MLTCSFLSAKICYNISVELPQAFILASFKYIISKKFKKYKKKLFFSCNIHALLHFEKTRSVFFE